MSKSYKLYPRGFVFSEKKLSIPVDYYKEKRILNHFHYYYDEASINSIYEDIDNGKFIIVHGHHLYVKQNNNINLAKHLLDTYFNDRNSFLDIIDFIAGRYVIIIGNKEKIEFFQDAAGMRTVYYSIRENIASSHVHLLGHLLCLDFQKSLESIWSKVYMWDLTPYEDIKSMLPNFSLELFSKKLERFFPRKQNPYSSLSEEERFQLIERYWKFQIEKYLERHPNMILSLTGGSDSRVQLAMVKEHIDKIKMFTYAPEITEERDLGISQEILKMDEKIVKEMLEDIPLNHRMIYFGPSAIKNTPEQIEVLKRNTIKPHGQWLIPLYREYFGDEDVLHLRGNLLEIGRAYFVKKDSKNTADEVEGIFYALLKKHFTNIKEAEEKFGYILKYGLKKFLYDKSLFGYHKMDLFYWEIRMGRWISEVLNENDVVFETLIPYNLRAIIDISLSFELKKRKRNYVFNHLINRNYPVLNFYGKNDERNLFERMEELISEKIKNEEKKLYFTEFSVYNSENEQLSVIRNTNNVIYIPKDRIKLGNYAETSIVFDKFEGIAFITLKNSYSNPNAKDYLKYSIYINDDLLLEEDISLWKFKNCLTILNLSKGDIIKIRISALRNAPRASWESASRLEIIEYEEQTSSKDGEILIRCTSPYSVIYK